MRGQEESARVALCMFSVILPNFGVSWVKNKMNHHLLCTSESSFSTLKVRAVMYKYPVIFNIFFNLHPYSIPRINKKDVVFF